MAAADKPRGLHIPVSELHTRSDLGGAYMTVTVKQRWPLKTLTPDTPASERWGSCDVLLRLDAQEMDTAIATGHTVTVYLYGAWARRVDERAQQGDLLTISGKGVAVQPNPLKLLPSDHTQRVLIAPQAALEEQQPDTQLPGFGASQPASLPAEPSQAPRQGGLNRMSVVITPCVRPAGPATFGDTMVFSKPYRITNDNVSTALGDLRSLAGKRRRTKTSGQVIQAHLNTRSSSPPPALEAAPEAQAEGEVDDGGGSPPLEEEEGVQPPPAKRPRKAGGGMLQLLQMGGRSVRAAKRRVSTASAPPPVPPPQHSSTEDEDDVSDQEGGSQDSEDLLAATPATAPPPHRAVPRMVAPESQDMGFTQHHTLGQVAATMGVSVKATLHDLMGFDEDVPPTPTLQLPELPPTPAGVGGTQGASTPSSRPGSEGDSTPASSHHTTSPVTPASAVASAPSATATIGSQVLVAALGQQAGSAPHTASPEDDVVGSRGTQEGIRVSGTPEDIAPVPSSLDAEREAAAKAAAAASGAPAALPPVSADPGNSPSPPDLLPSQAFKYTPSSQANVSAHTSLLDDIADLQSIMDEVQADTAAGAAASSAAVAPAPAPAPAPALSLVPAPAATAGVGRQAALTATPVAFVRNLSSAGVSVGARVVPATSLPAPVPAAAGTWQALAVAQQAPSTQFSRYKKLKEVLLGNGRYMFGVVVDAGSVVSCSGRDLKSGLTIIDETSPSMDEGCGVILFREKPELHLLARCAGDVVLLRHMTARMQGRSRQLTMSNPSGRRPGCKPSGAILRVDGSYDTSEPRASGELPALALTAREGARAKELQSWFAEFIARNSLYAGRCIPMQSVGELLMVDSGHYDTLACIAAVFVNGVRLDGAWTGVVPPGPHAAASLPAVQLLLWDGTGAQGVVQGLLPPGVAMESVYPPDAGDSRLGALVYLDVTMPTTMQNVHLEVGQWLRVRNAVARQLNPGVFHHGVSIPASTGLRVSCLSLAKGGIIRIPRESKDVQDILQRYNALCANGEAELLAQMQAQHAPQTCLEVAGAPPFTHIKDILACNMTPAKFCIQGRVIGHQPANVIETAVLQDGRWQYQFTLRVAPGPRSAEFLDIQFAGASATSLLSSIPACDLATNGRTVDRLSRVFEWLYSLPLHCILLAYTVPGMDAPVYRFVGGELTGPPPA